MTAYPTRISRFALTCAGAAYTAGDQVGDIPHWDVVAEAGTKAGVTVSVIGTLSSTSTPALDILLFERAPIGTSGDNNPASTHDSTVVNHFLGHVEVIASDWTSLANHSLFTKTTTIPTQHFQEGSPGRIWGLVVARSAYTPVALTVGIGVLVD